MKKGYRVSTIYCVGFLCYITCQTEKKTFLKRLMVTGGAREKVELFRLSLESLVEIKHSLVFYVKQDYMYIFIT